jgi:hypothetical protein
LAAALIEMAASANYMHEKASVKGIGYKNVEPVVSTWTGFNGQKLIEKEYQIRQRHHRENRAVS